MKKVAVTQRVDVLSDRDETRDGLDQRLVEFLVVAGFLPVPVPNGFFLSNTEQAGELLKRWFDGVGIDAILLSGGNDIGQCNERDTTETWLLDFASQHKFPVLGICRGMQMMASWAGVGCHPVDDHVRTKHQLTGEIVAEVNSYHGFSLDDCPVGFKVLAHSEDGEIEAIRHLSLPWEGWMWHPEREEIYPEGDIERARKLLNA